MANLRHAIKTLNLLTEQGAFAPSEYMLRVRKEKGREGNLRSKQILQFLWPACNLKTFKTNFLKNLRHKFGLNQTRTSLTTGGEKSEIIMSSSK